MLFVTSRILSFTDKTKFDFNEKSSASGNEVFFCKKTSVSSYEEIGNINFMGEIKLSKYKEVLIFIHGFHNTPEEIFERAEQLQMMFDNTSSDYVLVLPLIWHCNTTQGLISEYWSDQQSADQSAHAVVRILEKFMAWRTSEEHNPQDDPCLKRINILAHSMGNRVLRTSLFYWQKYFQPQGLPLIFRNIFMVAGDIANESLEKGEDGELISHSARNIVVYFASDDMALRASKVANLKNAEATRRLGHTGPEDMSKIPKNVYAVDCDEINNKYDFPKGHSYFLADQNNKPGLVFEHIFETIKTGRVFPQEEFRKTAIVKALE